MELYAFLSNLVCDPNKTLIISYIQMKKLHENSSNQEIDGLVNYLKPFKNPIFKSYSDENFKKLVLTTIESYFIFKNTFPTDKPVEELSDEDKIEIIRYVLQYFVNDLDVISTVDEEDLLSYFNKKRWNIDLTSLPLFDEFKLLKSFDLNSLFYFYFTTHLNLFSYGD